MRALHTTTTLLRSATLVGTLACACTTISLPCLGQEQVATVGQAGTLVWRGTKGPATPPPEDLSGYAELLKRELAAIQLAETVDGVGTKTEQRLRELWVRGALERDYPGRRDVLVELALARMGRDARRGWVDSALEEGSTLLPHHGTDANLALFFAQFDLVEADAATLRMQQEALADARLVTLRARLDPEAGPVNASASAPTQSIEGAVRKAVTNDQPDLVLELGSRAAPALEALVLSQVGQMPSKARSDPLVLLFQVSELRGAQVVLDSWEPGGFLFKKRVLRAMREAQVLNDVGTWSFPQMQAGRMELTADAPRMAEPIWLEVLARLASDPEVSRDSLDAVGFVATFDGLTEPLQAALMAALDGGDPDWVNDVLKALDRTRGRTTVVPVLEHALDHPLPHVRAFAAERLALYPRSDALRARADHPDVAVRRAAAASLVGKTGEPAYREDRTAYWMTDDKRFSKTRSIDERDVACLTRLLQDEDAEVREAATHALVRHPDLPIDTGVVVRLTRDANVEVRRLMTYWRHDKPVDPALLEALAADEEPEVLKQLDSRLEMMARTAPDGSQARGPGGRSDYTGPLLWNDSYLDALLVRLANPAWELGAKDALGVSGRSRAGASAIVAQAVSTGRPEVIHVVLDAMENERRSGNVRGAWHRVPGESLVALVRAAWSLPPEWRAKWRLWRLLADWPDESVGSMRSVLVDTEAPADLRLLAANLTAHGADAAWRETLLGVLVGLDIASRDERFDVADVVGRIPGRMPDSRARQVLLVELVGREDVPDLAVSLLTRGLCKDAAVSSALGIEILARYGDREGNQWAPLLGVALRALEPTEEEPQLELLGRLMANSTALDGVLGVMSRAHLEAHLPILEDGLMGRGFDSPSHRGEVQVLSAAALASYLDDQAAEILLKGLGSTNDATVRDACFAALETIRRYQDEKERWAQRKSSKQARDAAIAELVPMLADPDANVRAQAAKSLGALGAVEQLPALVRMLKDPEPEVRTAAQAAIDALTSSKDEG